MTPDVTELLALEVDLSGAPGRAQRQSTNLLRDQATAVRDSWRYQWTGMKGLGGLPRALGYDLDPGGFRRDAEVVIGVDKDGPQGPLGNIVEYGGSKHPPIRPVTEQLMRQAEPRVERALGFLGVDALALGREQ